MRNERPDPIDALIDEAAQRLTASEPSSALRDVVRDRIGQRRSAWSFVPAFAGVAALLVVAVIVGRALSGSPAGPDKVRPTGERAPIERTAPAVASQPDAPAAIQPAQAEARQLTRRLATVIPPPAEEESLVPPIAIAPLTPVLIAGDVSSGVMPIDIVPLQIEPLLGQGQ